MAEIVVIHSRKVEIRQWAYDRARASLIEESPSRDIPSITDVKARADAIILWLVQDPR